MGKPRLADLSEEDRVRVLRDVTRQLNEASQNARDAAKQLAGARDGLEASVAKTVQAIVDEHMERVNRHLKQAAADLMVQIATEEARTRDHYARLLGATTYQGLLNSMMDQIYGAIVPQLNQALRTLPGATGRTQISVGQRDWGVVEPGTVNVIDAPIFLQKLADGTAGELGTVIDAR